MGYFYAELLHIIGLTEVKEGGKKLIDRKESNKRDAGSIIENAITQLQALDKISRLDKPSLFGATDKERYFSVGLELVITWVNRILFLKLLEAQLIAYHKGDKNYSFLNKEKIKNFDDLNTLFFQVLARVAGQRDDSINKVFDKVPYLNSSLFEPTDLEHTCLFISQLQPEKELPILSGTVLKDNNGRKRTGKLTALEYLFLFLDAYDFSSEGSEEIQEENKTLINASVLGLIFEKINGYKDGSFFTPGFITMYMCRETIRRAVVQKFNETKGWNCNTINELYNKIEDKNEANQIVNSLKVCDPAVGSGHFLVSALNEIIAIKSDLKILMDRHGKTLRDYHVEVSNDELAITDENAILFEYNPKNKESQRIQEALFHEKQTLIENSLFGVDINTNSVKICRLRLWIELLKNAYYKTDSNFAELETLPNIDINIKCGNSLISRFALDADISQALKKSKITIKKYREAVQNYRHATSKEQKREMEQLISKIKGDFRTEISNNDPKVKRLNSRKGEREKLVNQHQLFELSKSEQKARNKKIEDLTSEIGKLSSEIDEIKSNKIYENAFEWRFEFPEILDDAGNFKGFDAVIANPPYVFARENFTPVLKEYFISSYGASKYQINLFSLFIERSLQVLTSNGQYSLIIPNSLLMTSSAQNIRGLLVKSTSLNSIVNLIGSSFEGVSVETVIISGKKGYDPTNNTAIYSSVNSHITYQHEKPQSKFLENAGQEFDVFADKEVDGITAKIKSNSVPLDDIVNIKAGLQAYETGKGIPKQTPEDVKNRPYDYRYEFDDSTFRYLDGKDVNRYYTSWSGQYLRYGPHLAAPRTIDLFNGSKIIIREITGKHPAAIIATYSDEMYLFNRSNIVIVKKENILIELKIILAILNSNLMSYYFMKNTAKAMRQMFPKLILEDLRKFPIKLPDKDQSERLIVLVDKILSAKKANNDYDVTVWNSEINKIIYLTYELTGDEIKVLEQAK